MRTATIGGLNSVSQRTDICLSLNTIEKWLAVAVVTKTATSAVRTASLTPLG
jgi:hypothetical protein